MTMKSPMRRVLVIGVAIMVGAGCSDDPQPQTQVPALPQDRGATFAQDSMRDWFIETSVAAIPGTEYEISGVLGEPDSVERLPSPSPRDPVAYDTIVEAFYPGINVSILKVGSDEMLQTVWVTDTAYISGPITIGTDTLTLGRLLGPPMLGGERPGYVCGMCSVPGQTVRFEIVDGRVTAIIVMFPS